MTSFNPIILNEYVLDRDAFLKKKSEVDEVSYKDAKSKILKCINASSKQHALTLGSYCDTLYLEVVRIREHIFDNVYTKDVNSYMFQYLYTDISDKKKSKGFSSSFIFTVYGNGLRFF